MKVLIAADNTPNSYIASLAEAYKEAGCEVVIDVDNFHLSNYSPDILHIHWPEYLFPPGHLSMFGEPVDSISHLLQQFKKRGATIVYTAHNLRPHTSSGSSVEEDVYELVYAMSDVVVHHGKVSESLLTQEHPLLGAKKNIVCPHGDYLIEYQEISKEDARGHLGLPSDAFVLLSFGNIKQYKGFGLLRRIYKQWKHKRKYLVVAGKYAPASSGDLVAKIIGNIYKLWLGWSRNPLMSNKHYALSTIEPSDVASYFSAADAVILTHTSGLTSGILAMAATFRRPVVYPDIGNFREQMEGWVSESYAVNDARSAVDALQRLSQRIRLGESFDNTIWLGKNTWAEHVEKILSAIEDLRNA